MNPPSGLLTQGAPASAYRLPHLPLGLPVILVIRQVLLRAFEMLMERGFDLAKEKEDRITTALRNIIENELRQSGAVSGFDRRRYDTVVRHAQTENFDSTKLAKAPDLWFKLRHDDKEPRPVLSTQDALFVECKPVDGDHAAGSAYCDDGLIRFIRGDYAWAMPEAMMVGYSRAGRTISGHLVPAMSEPSRLATLKTEALPTAVTQPVPSERAEALYQSRHQRGFPWPEDKGPATEITIYHSWHRCD